jgi:hypothetical protein
METQTWYWWHPGLKLIFPIIFSGQLSCNTITRTIISISTAGFNGDISP